MQSYHLSSARLCDSGKTQTEIENSADYNPAIHGIVDTGQVFDDWETRKNRFEYWHYVPGLNQFFLTTRTRHGFISAMETLFDPVRWEEIEHVLEEHDIHRLLLIHDMPRVKKKFGRARDKGLITADEALDLNQAFTS